LIQAYNDGIKLLLQEQTLPFSEMMPPSKCITINDLQNSTQKTKDGATRTPLKTLDEHGRLRENKQFLIFMWQP